MSYFYVACTVLVPLLSILLFNEPLTSPKVIGLALIVTGIIVGGQG